MNEQILVWLTLINALTGLFYAVTITVGLIGLRRMLRRLAKEEAQSAPGEGADSVDAVVARVLCNRLELMLATDLIPEGLADMAVQLEVFAEDSASEEQVASAWSQAVHLARLRLGDLSGYYGVGLVAHASHVSRAMYNLARAAWRMEDSPESMLLGQAYECVATIIEQTVIGEWPSNEQELARVLEYDPKRRATNSPLPPLDSPGEPESSTQTEQH